ncbi:MAG: ECF transporter S component [Oscillospiraceae bacterium]|nr:ECF transporter S component [Oscillospiraceae bacterium]
MKKTGKTKTLVILGMLTALLLLFSFTPIGTVPVGPLSVTLNPILIAIGAIALGPVGGLVVGSMFGILSFLQCLGIGVASGMGAILFDINPFLAFVQRFIPRALDGLLVGLIFRAVETPLGSSQSCFVAGFSAAFLNTLFFMSALVLCFGNTEYLQGLIKGRNIFVFVCAFVGFNAVVEMIVTTIVAGIVGTALYRSRILPLSADRTVREA